MQKLKNIMAKKKTQEKMARYECIIYDKIEREDGQQRSMYKYRQSQNIVQGCQRGQ